VSTLACAAPLGRDDFAYAMRLQADGKDPLYRLDVPQEVYAHTVSRELADLRVFNAKGEVVPYALDRRGEQAAVGPPQFQEVPIFPLRGDDAQGVRGLNLSIRTDSGALELRSPTGDKGKERLRGYVVDAHAVTRPIAGFDVEWGDAAPEFSETVTLEVSSDLTQWQAVRQATLVNLHFNGQALRQQRVEFPAMGGRYWRLLWPANREAASISTVRALLQPGTPMVARDVRVVDAKAGQAGEYLVDLGAQPPVDRVNVRLPERNSVVEATLYSRARSTGPWRSVARGNFFRLARGGEAEVGNDALAIAQNRDRYWRVTVSGVGLGSGVPQLVVQWVPQSLLFVARGEGPFELVFGSAVAGSAEAPLDSMIGTLVGESHPAVQEVPTAALPAVELGGSARLLPPAPPTPWKKWLLWAVLGVGVLLLAYFAWRLSRELGSEGK
jgi:hypothetical protein